MVVIQLFQQVLQKNFCYGVFHRTRHSRHASKYDNKLRYRPLSSTLPRVFQPFQPIVMFVMMTCAAIAQATDASDGFFYHLETKSFRVLDSETCERDYKKAQRDEQVANSQFRDAISADLQSDAQSEIQIDPDEYNSLGLIRSWSPTGTRKRAVRPACSADALEYVVLNSSQSIANQATGIRNFFKACGDEMLFDAPPTWLGLLSISNTRYEYCKHPRIRKVMITMPDGNILRGILAMKPGEVARPLVIIKCGVFCNSGDTSHRFQIMHLFDEGPFNVLAVSNVTGAEYIIDNEHLEVGGFDEGMQIIRLANMIEQMPLSRYVSSLHFSGVSLGAQSAFYASFLNQYNLSSSQAPHFKSFLAMCPVVELQPSISSLFGNSMKGKIARRLFLRQFLDILTHVPVLGRYFPGIDQIPTNKIPEHVAEGAVAYYKSVGDDWALPPFSGRRIRDMEDLWKTNSFIGLADQMLETPTLAFASEDDWIVTTSDNAGALALRLGNQINNKLQVVTVPQGNHCAFGTMYGWDVASAVVRNYVISHSPELLRRRRIETAAIRPDRVTFRLRPGETEKHISQDFEAQTGRNFIRVTFNIWDSYENTDACFSANMYQGSRKCIRKEEIRIPLSDIGASWARVPNTGIEAEILTRWLNANLRIVDRNGQLLRETSAEPARLRWVSYESGLALPGRPTRPQATVANPKPYGLVGF